MSRLLFRGAAAVAVCARFFCCNKRSGGAVIDDGGKVVYVISNDYHDNANAVLAYRRKADGSLAPVPGSPFPTRGAGLANPKQVLARMIRMTHW